MAATDSSLAFLMHLFRLVDIALIGWTRSIVVFHPWPRVLLPVNLPTSNHC